MRYSGKLLSGRIIIACLTLAIFGVHGAAGQAPDLNLAPNASFELGTGTSADAWGLLVATGSATAQVVNYPGSVLSGNRAVQINVTLAGDINFATLPESTAILVEPSHVHTFSARLLSSGGARAGLRVIEWNTAGGFVWDRFLTIGGGSGDWVTLEASFTTMSSTRYVSLRLVHNIDVGTFTWDDVAFWTVPPKKLGSIGPDVKLADVRHFIMQSTPGFQMCTNPFSVTPLENTFCFDAHRDASNEFVRAVRRFSAGQWIEHGRDIYLHTGNATSLVSVQKDHTGNDATVGWRCFADPGRPAGSPNAAAAPATLGRSMILPILAWPGGSGPSTRTPGAFLVHDWQPFVVLSLDPSSGIQTYSFSINKRVFAYLVNSIDFGGGIGIQGPVLVVEEEQSASSSCPDGSRLERYFYVPVLGHLRQQGWINGSSPVCEDPVYNTPPQNDTFFNYKWIVGDYELPVGSPVFDKVNWW